MKFGKTYRQILKKEEEDAIWKPWFAWRPVKLDNGQYAWLETVFRRKLRACYGWFYSEKLKDY